MREEYKYIVNSLLTTGLLFTCPLVLGNREPRQNLNTSENNNILASSPESTPSLPPPTPTHRPTPLPLPGVMPRMSAEKRLCRSLMMNYTLVGLNGRPVVNMSRPTVVDFGLGLIQMDLDERNKILTTSMWARYKWTDEYLRWEPADYSGVRSIKLMSHAVWKPDIMLYNTAETDKAEREVLAVVGYDGTVLWVPHQIFRSSCSIDVSNFPFDYQECSMFFGSWTYSIEDVDPQLAFDSGIDLSTFMSDYKESCAWEIVNNTAERKALPEENPTYVVLSFTLKMRRKMVFSTYILTLPCVFLATLTLVVFWLPPDRPDRTSLAMSIFSSFLVLLLILVEAAPPTASSIPTLGVYYCFNMVIIMMSIFLSTLVVNVCRGGDNRERVPKCITWLVLHVFSRIFFVHGKVLTMTRHNHRAATSAGCTGNATGSSSLHGAHAHQSHNHNGSSSAGTLAQSVGTAEENCSLLGNHVLHHHHGLLSSPPAMASHSLLAACDSDLSHHGGLGSSPSGGHHGGSGNTLALQAEVAAMKSSLADMAAALNSRCYLEERKRQISLEWKCVGLIMDRAFFYLYLCAIIISLVLLFPRPQQLQF